MKKSRQHQVPFYQYIISLVCMAFLSGGFFYLFFNHQYKTQLAANSFSDKSLSKIDNFYKEIMENYVGEVDKNKLIDGALQGMSDALDDPYSSYLDESAADQLNQTITGSFEGIGATITLKNDLPTIAEPPVDGSPAKKAGLQVNDVILAIDDTDTKGLSLEDVVAKIRGNKNTKVQLTILRDEETLVLEVTRDEISIETVNGSIDKTSKNVGVIRVSSFSSNTSQEFKEVIKQLRKSGATSFVIDVRQNPGGLLEQAEKMASMFLKNDQVIVNFEDKEGNTAEVVASKKLDDGFKITEPTVVLVDNGSASASEIFAAALKESANKTIVGTTTYGKGKVQTVKKLSDNSEIKLTVLKWLTPTGEWVQDKGLRPTIEATYPSYAYLSSLPKDTVLKEGDQSSTVKNLNAILNALSYSVDETSIEYSQETADAVRSIQTDAQTTITGEVDSDTATIIEQLLMQKISDNDNAYKTALHELEK